MAKVTQRRIRDFSIIEDYPEIENILQNQFKTRKLYIKYTLVKTEIKVKEFLGKGMLILITDPAFEHEEAITIYGLLDKYIEIDLAVTEAEGPGLLKCELVCARIALNGRSDLRFKLDPGEVIVTNFRVSKYTIDLSSFNIPTSIKVILDQFQKSNSAVSDIFRIDIFKGESEPLIQDIKRTGKTLFIPEVSNIASYSPLTDDFVDAAAIFGAKLNLAMKKYLEKGYKSIIIVPVLYVSDNETSTPFAYIELISKSEVFGIEKVLEVKEYSFRLIDRIRESNTLLISVHQQLEDISRGGAKLRITDENLKKSMLKSKGFIFDIVFKLQAPITIYAGVKSTFIDRSGDLFVGIDFEGNSSRKDQLKRFYAILKPLEIQYKDRLMSQIKVKEKVARRAAEKKNSGNS